MKNIQTISVVLEPADKTLVAKLQRDFERRLGMRIPITQLVRHALRELARQQANKTA